MSPLNNCLDYLPIWEESCSLRASITRRGFISASLAAGATFRANASAEQRTDLEPFLVYYGDEDDPAIRQFRLAVLDPDANPAIPKRYSASVTCLGYLSAAEINSFRSYFQAVAAEGLLLAENRNWPNAHFVDARDIRWHQRVLKTLVPDILAKGFKGLFIDTLDSAEFLETQDSARFKGMITAAADLVRAIRREYPNVPIMINRGYAVLPLVAGQFEMLLAESLRTAFEASSSSYHWVSERDYTWQLDRMRAAQTLDPRVRLFGLDYWDPADRQGIARIYQEERARGIIPYVTTPDLRTIVLEP